MSRLNHTAALIAALSLIPLSTPAYAHEGQPIAPHDLPSAWNSEPSVLLGLLLIGSLYLRGLTRLWSRAGPGRGIQRWRSLAFLAGLLTLLAALVSPIHALGSALFSGHMLQHLLLTLLAAPLLVLGRPERTTLWALPEPTRRRLGSWWRGATALRTLWRLLTLPALVWLLHALSLWLWHLPRAYELAVRDEFFHSLEHLTFLLTACLFWWLLLERTTPSRLQPGADILFLFTFVIQSGVLGALITFASRPWYPIYQSSTLPWGLTPLEDQQLAGLIMWIPGGLIYAAAALALLAHWIHYSENQARRREQSHLPT